MDKITIVVIGNGTAYVDDPNPEPNQIVTLQCFPDPNETLDDIYAVDSGGHYIAFTVAPTVYFNYSAAYGNMTITVTFSGSTPPTPTFNMWWLLKRLADKNRKCV